MVTQLVGTPGVEGLDEPNQSDVVVFGCALGIASHTAVQSSGHAGSRCGGHRECIGRDWLGKRDLINSNNFYSLHNKFLLISLHYKYSN